METVRDFEDILELFARHKVRYLFVGGLAFIYHAKPRYTKDINLWIDPETDNVKSANQALGEFGSPEMMTVNDPQEVLQLGVAPNRIDLLRNTVDLDFNDAWPRRVESHYGRAPANWIDIDSLFTIKSGIDHPRHQEDARILKMVIERRKSS